MSRYLKAPTTRDSQLATSANLVLPKITPALRTAVATLAMLLVLAVASSAQDLAAFEQRVTVKKLPNGLTALVCVRPRTAPVFSFYTNVDAGSVQDPMGKTGLAHMFEHMAFKGTTTIGTTDYPAEKAALQKVEDIYAQYLHERDKPVGRDEQKVKQLEQQWQDAIKEAQKYVIPNQFSEIIEQSGGQDINASTSDDHTEYHYSLTSNRLELWAYLESQRFIHPVFREFYKERNVVMEERRMRTDSSPIGKLIEQFLEASYTAHPYHRPTIGYMSDLNSFSATDATAFFDRYYIPSNMVVAVVGDVDPNQAMSIIEKYFGQIPSQEKPDERTTTEPPQDSERRIVLQEQSQPVYLEGYHRPSYRDKDDAVYDALADLLSDGRTSRLYRSLVRDKKIASEAEGGTGFPGVKYPHIFYFFAAPMPGHTPEEVGKAIHEEINRLKTQDITDDELRMVKTRSKANLLRSLDSNEGLAEELAIYQTLYGDWRELFRSVDRIDAVSKADIRRVANQVFVPTNRTVAIIENAAAAKGGAQ
jgi:predicted Zn-dependent peptidase